MTSIGRSTRQINRDGGYYVPLGSLVGLIYSEPTVAANGTMPALSTAAWAKTGGAAGRYLSTISSVGAGGLLKDMGKTLVSGQRTFRKVQLVVSTTSTFGVAGTTPTTAGATEDYLTGYIELGLEGYGAPAPVAQFGR